MDVNTALAIAMEMKFLVCVAEGGPRDLGMMIHYHHPAEYEQDDIVSMVPDVGLLSMLMQGIRQFAKGPPEWVTFTGDAVMDTISWDDPVPRQGALIERMNQGDLTLSEAIVVYYFTDTVSQVAYVTYRYDDEGLPHYNDPQVRDASMFNEVSVAIRAAFR